MAFRIDRACRRVSAWVRDVMAALQMLPGSELKIGLVEALGGMREPTLPLLKREVGELHLVA